MTERGLRSVILIGGGEPTVHPRFREMVRFLKGLDLQVAIVSNGARNDRILDVVDVLGDEDWIRLSLDAGTNATFQAMHSPKKAVTLEEICAWIPQIRDRNPIPRVGFSFVVTWKGAERTGGDPVVENLHEIVRGGASRARRSLRLHLVQAVPRAHPGGRRDHRPGSSPSPARGGRRPHPHRGRRSEVRWPRMRSPSWRART